MRPCWEEEGVDGDSPQAEIEIGSNRRGTNNAIQGERGNGRRRRNAEEIVYLVKKGGVMPLRPKIQPAMADLNPALVMGGRGKCLRNPFKSCI